MFLLVLVKVIVVLGSHIQTDASLCTYKDTIFMTRINNYSNVELQLTQVITICHPVGTDL